MWVKKLLGVKPRVIYSVDSPYSGKINVWEQQGSLTLEVGGYPQSVSLNTPSLSQRYWARATEEVVKRLTNPKRGLVIGVGGATILHLLSQKFPNLHLSGVEIDLVIMEIAREFFELESIKNLELSVMDGGEYVTKYRGELFDLAFVDAYLGGNFPPHFEEEQFLRQLRRITTPTGWVVINRASGFDSGSFERLLRKVFAKVEVVRIPLPGFLGGLGGNFLFFCHGST